MNWKTFNILLIALLFGAISCGVYSFQGATIDYATTKTISIANFFNDTPNGPANLSQAFTEELRDYYQQNTNLTLVSEEGDLQLEGRIVGYETSPVAPRASQDPNGIDFTNLTRLTITVEASYINVNDDTFDFEGKRFSFFSDFDNTQNSLTDVEDELIDEIFEQIVIDIFNATVANW